MGHTLKNISPKPSYGLVVSRGACNKAAPAIPSSLHHCITNQNIFHTLINTNSRGPKVSIPLYSSHKKFKNRFSYFLEK